MLKKLFGVLVLLFCFGAYAEPIRIVAAENFYGQMAEQLGGLYVQVVSILKNPQQDPHLFSSSPATAKAIARAQVIIYNGLGYDPWMQNLVAAANDKNKSIIIVGDLMGKHLGDNPHIWYDPKTMLVFANALTTQLSQMDPQHQNYYQQQLDSFKKAQQPFLENIQQLRQHYSGTAVIATEPVFNYMAEALGLQMQGQGFQTSIMNETEPSVSDTKDFEDQLKNHRVKVLIYNSQVIDPTTERMKKIAEKVNIPIVGVSETEPEGQDYFTWMGGQLIALEKQLRQKQLRPEF